MSWFKILVHDLRRGLFRLRYLIIFIIAWIPCIQLYTRLHFNEISGSLMDYLLYTFQGMAPVVKGDPINKIQLPILWLVIIGSCLFLNLDYMLTDLTKTGQQIIVRGNSRQQWFLSKYLWNFLSTVLFFSCIIISQILFVIIMKERVSFHVSQEVIFKLFYIVGPLDKTLSVFESLLLVVIAPFFTIAAFNIMQMTLCLFIKPIISFLICMATLILSIYCNSPFALGNGAMTIRSILITASGHDPSITISLCVLIFAICVVMGTIRFKFTDILNLDE